MNSTADNLRYISWGDLQRSRAIRGVQPILRRALKLAGRYRGLIALCDQGVVSISNFATAMIIGRVCGKAELGVYTLAWTLIALVTGISATLTTTPYTVLGPRLGRSRRRRYLGSIVVHHLLLALLFAMAMAAGAILASRQGWVSDSISNAVTTTAAVIVFISLREFVRGVSFAELRPGWAFSVDVIACLAQAAGILLMLHFRALTASRTLALLGISSAVAAGAWFALHRQALRSNARLYVPDLKRNWGFSKWVLGSALTWQSATYLYPWMLTAFHGTAVTGVWAACCAIVAAGNPVLLGLTNYVSPKIANEYAAGGILKMKRYVQRSSLMFAALLLPLVLVLAGFGERIVTAVYGRAYNGTAGVVFLLAANMLVNSLANPYSQGLFNLRCAKADMFVNAVSVAILFAAGIPAVKSYAALGAAMALFASSSIAAGIRIGVFARELRRRGSTPAQTLA